MAERIFRQKSLDRINAPDDLNEYLRVTNPAIWVIMVTVIALIAALFIWSSFTAVGSYAYGHATAKDGVLTVTFDDQIAASNVKTGMNVTVGDISVPVLSLGRDAEGGIVAAANADVPDGTYSVRVGYKSTQIIDFLLN